MLLWMNLNYHILVGSIEKYYSLQVTILCYKLLTNIVFDSYSHYE